MPLMRGAHKTWHVKYASHFRSCLLIVFCANYPLNVHLNVLSLLFTGRWSNLNWQYLLMKISTVLDLTSFDLNFSTFRQLQFFPKILGIRFPFRKKTQKWFLLCIDLKFVYGFSGKTMVIILRYWESDQQNIADLILVVHRLDIFILF